MRPPVFHRRFGYDLDQLPNHHLRALENNVESIEEARLKSGASIGYPGWAVIYSCGLSSLNPDVESHVIIETGTNYGATTIVLAQVLKDATGSGVVHTFEIEPENVRIAKNNISRAGLSDLVKFHIGDSRSALPSALAGLNKKVSLAFLDGAHEADILMSEFSNLYDYLSDGAIVFLDNTYPIAEPDKGDLPRVNQAIPQILERFGGHIVNLRFASWYTPGLAIWQKSLPLRAEHWLNP